MRSKNKKTIDDSRLRPIYDSVSEGQRDATSVEILSATAQLYKKLTFERLAVGYDLGWLVV